MYLSTFKKNEYLASTCTWYIFVVLGVLEYLVYLSTWSTVLDPNPAVDTCDDIVVSEYEED